MNDKFLDIVFREDKNINACVYQLDKIAQALSITGNENLSWTLMDLADRIATANKNISDAIGEDIHNSLQKSRADLAETTSLVLSHIFEKQGNEKS